MKELIIIFNLIFFAVSPALSQPFILNIQSDRDSLNYFQTSDSTRVYIVNAEYIQRINLGNNETTEEFKNEELVGNVFFLKKDSLSLILQDSYWSIYDVYNNQVIYSFPAPYSCVIDVIFTNNSIYGFSCNNYEDEEFCSVIFKTNLSTNLTDSILSFPFYGSSNNCGINFSRDGIIHFEVEDTNHTPFRFDLTMLTKFSTTTNQIVSQTSLSELGYQGADGFTLHKGRNGIGIIESFYYNNDEVDSYYRTYDFNTNTGSNFIFHQGISVPYITIDQNYLILAETTDSAGYVYNTGILFFFDINTTNLLKTISLPGRGYIHMFDNYPKNIYYVINVEEPTRQIYTLKMDSILNVLDLTSLDPSSAIVNSSPFTLTVNGNGFDTLSTVYYNDTAKTTTVISDSVLTAEISTSDISVVGDYPVWVTDEWGTSDTHYFSVLPEPPVLTSISPAIYLRPSPFGIPPSSITITASGEFFTDSSVVYFNGNAKTTTYVSDSVLTFQLTSQNLASVGNYPVWVSNYGTNSDTLTFSVVDNLPQSIAPTLQCVHNNGGGSFTAYFGYNNNNNVGVYIPVSNKNGFTPTPSDRGQPKIFLPGSHTNVFSVTYSSKTLTWSLYQSSVTANSSSTPCP